MNVRAGSSSGGRPAMSPVVWFRLGLLGVASAAIFVLLSTYGRPLPWIVYPIWVGCMVGVALKPGRASLVVSFSSTLVGALASLYVCGPDRVAAAFAAMPPIANKNITYMFYSDVLVAVHNGHLAESLTGTIQIVAVAVGAAILSLAATWVIGMLPGRLGWSAARFRRWVAVVLAGVLSVSLVWSALAFTEQFREIYDVEPLDETYQFDPDIMIKAYYLMEDGTGYYDAMAIAATNDMRMAGSADPDGELTFPEEWGWAQYPRQPWLHYLWTLATPANASWVIVLSMLVAGVLPTYLFLSFREELGPSALIPSALVFPALLMHTTWLNVFHHDWWATLCLLYAVPLALNRRWLPATILALVAALFREVMLVLLALVVLGAILDSRAKKKGVLPALASSGASLGLFALLYSWHMRVARDYLPGEGSSAGPVAILKELASRPMEEKLLSPMHYLMFPYTQLAFCAVWLPPVAALSALALPFKLVPRLVLSGYMAFWFVFYLTVGAASSYWGQEITIISILAVGMFVASLVAGKDRMSLAVRTREAGKLDRNGLETE